MGESKPGKLPRSREHSLEQGESHVWGARAAPEAPTTPLAPSAAAGTGASFGVGAAPTHRAQHKGTSCPQGCGDRACPLPHCSVGCQALRQSPRPAPCHPLLQPGRAPWWLQSSECHAEEGVVTYCHPVGLASSGLRHRLRGCWQLWGVQRATAGVVPSLDGVTTSLHCSMTTAMLFSPESTTISVTITLYCGCCHCYQNNHRQEPGPA